MARCLWLEGDARGGLRRFPCASSAGRRSPSLATHRRRSQPLQQGREPSGPIRAETLEQRTRKGLFAHRGTDAPLLGLPPLQAHELLMPPPPPPAHRPPVDAEFCTKACQPRRCQLPSAGQHQGPGPVDPPPVEAHRRREFPLAAGRTAQAQALAVLLVQAHRPAAHLARVARAVEPPPAQRASPPAGPGEEVLVNAQQVVVESKVIKYA